MLSMNVTKDFDLSKIKLDLSPELNMGIDIIAVDIRDGIDRGDQFGAPFKRNAESTIKKKGFDHPLKHKGLMMNADKMVKRKAKPNNQIATLSPHNKRVDIGYWNDTGTDTIPARHFWGISPKAEKRIIIKVSSSIEKELRRA